jgi:hypothetical protein
MEAAVPSERNLVNAQKTALLLFFSIISVGCDSFAEKAKPAIALTSPQEQYRIVTKNESKNGELVTIVSLERMAIIGPDVGEPIGFSSMFAYDKKSQAVPAAYISFYSNGSKCRFPSKSKVTFIADGQAIRIADDPVTANLGEGKSISLSEPGPDGCKESLDVLLPPEVYFRIANAQIVDVQFGELKFRLNENHLNALRELARRMAVSKP